MISINFKAFFRPCKREKGRERRAMKGGQVGRGMRKALTLLLIFISSTLEIVSGEKKTPV